MNVFEKVYYQVWVFILFGILLYMHGGTITTNTFLWATFGWFFGEFLIYLFNKRTNTEVGHQNET